MKNYVIWAIALVLIGIGFLVPGMKGYMYITFSLFLAAFVIIAVNVFPDGLKRWTLTLVSLGLIYLIGIESIIVSNASTDKNDKKSYVVVLGAAVNGSKPTLSLTHRLQAAESYLKKYPDSIAVVSGGQGDGEDISEAQCMRDVLIENGIEKERIIIEDKSTSTIENLTFSKEIILKDGGSMDDVAILSSPYHLYRAKKMAEMIGYINPAGVAGIHGYPIYSLGMYIREAFGVTSLMLRGR